MGLSAELPVAALFMRSLTMLLTPSLAPPPLTAVPLRFRSLSTNKQPIFLLQCTLSAYANCQ